MIYRDKITTMSNEIRKGHSRDVVLSKTKLVRPTYRELHDKVMPQKASSNVKASSTVNDDDDQQQHHGLDINNDTTQQHQQHNKIISKVCLETNIL